MARVLASNRYILGEEVAAFETDFASYIGVSYGVGVASGTDALMLALKAVGVGPGDEVITVSFTSVATVAAIELAGGVPVLVDIEPDYYTIDPASVAQAITPRTKAIVPVHLYGQPAALAELSALAKANSIALIEDCAQAHGALYRGRRVGSWGAAGCFSFYPTKNVGALGDGGMVVTSDTAVAELVRQLRQYGWNDQRISLTSGVNSRLDELQAAVLRVKLRYLDEERLARERVAQTYQSALKASNFTLPVVRDDAAHAWHLYVVRSPAREALRAQLRKQGIEASVHYPLAVHQQPAYAERLTGSNNLRHTDAACSSVLSIPIYPQMTVQEVAGVLAALQSCRVAAVG